MIPAHRLVLSAGSEYFNAMFTNDLREASQSEVVMHEVDGDALWELVHYCYTGKIELREETVEVLLSTASILQLHEVVAACCSFLRKQLHPSNCIGICIFAENQGCTGLQTSAHNYIIENFMNVICNQEFLLLPIEEVTKLLASEDVKIPSEEEMLRALKLWIKHDIPNRQKYVGKLLSLIKLPLLPASFIADQVQTEDLFKDDPTCQELIMEALNYHLLPERRPMLQTVRTRPRKSTVGIIYAVGGMDANKAGATSIEQYDCWSNRWSHVANLPGRRLQFGVAVVEGKLFVVGGRDGLKTLNSVECFDAQTHTWAPSPPMATHRHGLGVGVLGGPLYAVGGHDGWSYLSTVERWDPQVRQWSFVASMSTARSTVGVAVLNNRLYAVGGRDGSSCLRTVECYDPFTNKWTACASMSKRRGGVGVAVLNGYLYAVGGHDVPATNPHALRFCCVERYDPKTNSWTLVANMSVGRDSVGVSLLGDHLFAVGGYDGQYYLQLVEAYDSQTNEWNQVASLNTGRAGACVVVVPPIRQ
ncbi:LOW QUALITY PROTEIN: kelch-like protein 5 [Nilaparvata lugens]|uniref:LOW QUALITY PROTEIN: kelch-like protein 5 n=1 Tax=Nilaparvata lugens TaxID=108931 RepID=UPI00193D7975|nr:LOW QUALITY PROTEIN: kelch-like protein 5 [Nilaparvata lugens]